MKFDPKVFLNFFKNALVATQNTIGIDVGEGYIKIVQLQKSHGGYLLTDYRVKAIPYKIKDNAKERNEFVKEFINEFITQSRLKTQLGRLAIKGSGIFTFSFSLPPLSEKDLRGAVGIELKKRLPFQIDFNNIHYNYFVTERFEEESPAVMVTCIAIDNSVLDRHLDFLKRFKLRPVTINSTSDALGNLILAVGEQKCVGVLDMGTKMSYLNFYKKGLLQFSREIPVGGEQLTQSILKALVPLGGNISFEDAEAFKRQCGVPMQEEAEIELYTDFGAIKGSQITTALRPVLERLVTEISRTVTFYFRTYKLDNLDALYLTGGASRMRSIDLFLQANLGNLPVKTIEKLNPLKAIKGWLDSGVFKQELVMEEAAPHLTIAFGLCIDKGGQVNLVPPKEKIEQNALFAMFIARLAMPIVLGGMLAFYTFTYLNAMHIAILNQRAEKQIQQFESQIKDIQDYLALKQSRDSRESLLNRAIGRQPLWWGVLKELSVITPEEVTVYSVSVKPGENPKKMVILGVVVSEYTNIDLKLSQYTIVLNESPFFANVKLVGSEKDEYSPIPKARFEIICDLKI